MTKFLKRAEWALAILLSAAAIFFLVARCAHAGALWRDEAAVANLARMPSVTDIAQNFQHEAFPLPFPLLVRAYTSIVGTSDLALRSLGFLAGIAVLAAIWIAARLIHRGPPLIALALLGLNTTFLFWGTTVRGYGFGSAFIILAFALIASLLREFSTSRIITAALVSLVAVQCLVHNLALIAALVFAAALASLLRHDSKRLITFLGIFALCVISLLPYLNAYSNSWSQVVEFPVTAHLLWNQFNFALGNPNPLLASLWHVAFLVLLGAAIWKLFRSRTNRQDPEWNLLFFSSLTLIAAAIAYY